MSHQSHIEDYFAACTAGDAARVAGCFTADAVVYDLNHRPVRGAEQIAAFFARVREQWTDAAWWVDTFLEGGDRAVSEWAMSGRKDGEPFVVRGSEHYAFDGGLIAEIRQYWRFDPSHPDSGLVDFNYADDPRFALGPPPG